MKGDSYELYNEIKNELINNELYKKVKDYSKERYRVITYFEIGNQNKTIGIIICKKGNKFIIY